MTLRTATLKDGRTLQYEEVSDPPAGGMKKVYFTPDRSQVVAFFHDLAAANDANRMARLEAVLGRFNPTIDSQTGDYWKQLFCWPTAIVTKPALGIVAPCYPGNYFFQTGPFKEKEKKGKWFTSPKLRGYLPPAEKGQWIQYLMIGIRLARAISRLHLAGLAHSDLSCNNVLIDPTTGQCVVIDIDSLVVPGMFPPDVLGTPGYIAPEVLGTQHLPLNDPNRKHPSSRTDQHALPVLLYEYLLFRHPLRGPKIHSTESAEKDELLSMGSQALFVEHPTDKTNALPNLEAKTVDLGPQLHDLFQRAFVRGLHSPNDRPAAIEWERAMVRTFDLLHPCINPNCAQKWFVVHAPAAVRCPFCQTKLKDPVPVLKLRKEIRSGQWLPDGTLVVHGTAAVYGWHAYDNLFPGPTTNRTRLGYFIFHQGKWLLMNEAFTSLTSPGGSPVPVGSAVELHPGTTFRLAQGPNGRMADVEYYPV